MQTHSFIKEGADWYIDLPEYIEQGGSKGDLAMVEGADTMLDIMAGGNTSVTLQLSEEAFDGADLLLRTELCEPYIGGAYYLLDTWEGKNINHNMWLCAVTEFVFGSLPEKIFIRRVN
ncbi:MAG: hypothetical protein QM731_20680 [Chitinophagaceae bacterium]